MRIAICLRWLFMLSIIFVVAPATYAVNNQQEDKPKIIMGVHPYLPAPEIQKRFGPLVAYLEKHLQIEIELHISQSYKTHIEHVANNALDIAFMGPSSYVALTKQYSKHPLLARLEVNGKPHLYGNIIVHKDSGIKNIKQLNGARFAFGSPHSTMSYIVPRHLLGESGVMLEHLGKYKFLGNHRNVALGILLGDFDAGAVKEEVFHEFRDKGLVSIAKTPAISEHVFVTRNGFPVARLNAIRSLMFKLAESSEGLEILRSIKPTLTGLVPAKHKDYKNLIDLMDHEYTIR